MRALAHDEVMKTHLLMLPLVALLASDSNAQGPELPVAGVSQKANFERAVAGRTLEYNEIAVVTYWHAPLNVLAQIYTVHYGPGETIKSTLGDSRNDAMLKIGIHSGYIIRSK